MNIVEIKEKMKTIQNALLEFLEDESNLEENYENFIKVVSDFQITEDKYKFKSIMQLINAIGNNHYRVTNFICKLEQILDHFKKDLQNYFSNSEIFNIFKNNKRILLFLIEEKIMMMDEYIILRILNPNFEEMKYVEYFAPEIKPFFTKEFISKYCNKIPSLKNEEFIDKIMEELPEEFYDKRKKGENDDYLCELIRTNKVKDFGIYINKNNISLESFINQSIFETHPFLYESNIKLIEYASFFGSIDIIKYMKINGEVEFPPDIWYYVIHSNNAELIKYFEDNHVSPPYKRFLSKKKQCVYETILDCSIMCHHNDVSKYIMDYLIKEEELQNIIEKGDYDIFYCYAVEFCNYCFFPSNMKYKNMFFYLCQYGYYSLVELYLKEGNIDINAKIHIKSVHLI